MSSSAVRKRNAKLHAENGDLNKRSREFSSTESLPKFNDPNSKCRDASLLDTQEEILKKSKKNVEVEISKYFPTRSIITPVDQNSNQCLFYGIFNSLRTEEERVAFSGGRNEDPAQNFVNVIHQTEDDEERALAIGYNERDLKFYLNWLQQNKFIKSWIVKGYGKKQVNKNKNNKPNPKCRGGFSFSKLLNLRQDEEELGYKYLLCGDAVSTGPHRKKAIERIKKWKDAAIDQNLSKDEINLAGIRAYENFSEKYKPKWGHGVVVTKDKTKGDFIYDTSKFVETPLTMENMVSCIVHIKYAYKFKIII
jgi:hypothetical protein